MFSVIVKGNMHEEAEDNTTAMEPRQSKYCSCPLVFINMSHTPNILIGMTLFWHCVLSSNSCSI